MGSGSPLEGRVRAEVRPLKPEYQSRNEMPVVCDTFEVEPIPTLSNCHGEGYIGEGDGESSVQ